MNYKITDQTLYLRSTQKIGVVTEVVELEQTFYLMQDSLQIIDHSCTCYGSSYQGVVTCVKKLFHLKQNPPLPLDPLQGLYAFATHSPRSPDCIWVITKNIKAVEYREHLSIIYFINGTTLIIQMTKRRLQKLFACIFEYSLYFRS